LKETISRFNRQKYDEALEMFTSTDLIQLSKEERRNEMNNKVRDQHGNYILEGNYIAYPGRKGSSLFMRTAKVLEITKRKLPGEREENILKLVTAYIPRWKERKYLPQDQWDVRVRKVTIGQNTIGKSILLSQNTIQNAPGYNKLLEV
jgi:hypothetical protein